MESRRDRRRKDYPDEEFESENAEMADSRFVIKLVTIVVLAACVIFGIITAQKKMYDAKFTDLDLTANLTVTFEGDSGNGYVESVDNDVAYDEDNKSIAGFITSLTYTCAPRTELSNGDEVTVTVNYDEQEAEDLYLRITSSETTVTVNGLYQRFTSANEISKKLAKTLRKAADKKIESATNGTFGDDYSYTNDFVAMYFATTGNEDTNTDKVIAVYDTKVTPVDDQDSSTTIVTYVYYTGLDSQYDAKYTAWAYNELRDASNDYLKDDTQALERLKANYDSYTFTQLA